jgi:hypothetical protein
MHHCMENYSTNLTIKLDIRCSVRYSMVKDKLSFEILIFRKGQPYCDDDRIFVVAMTKS